MDNIELRSEREDLSREAWERLGRYLEGRSNSEEMLAVEQWLDAIPGRRKLVRQIEVARQAALAKPGSWAVKAAWQRVLQRVDGRHSTGDDLAATRPSEVEPVRPIKVPPLWMPGFGPRRQPPAQPRRQWGGLAGTLRMAAAVAALVGGGLLWQYRATVFAPRVALQEFATEVGERLQLTLADGTEVILGPASRIQVPTRFKKTRDVQLEGEAVFSVATDSARSFRVSAGATLTRVLGTRFSVHAYPEDQYVEVLVAEGRVAVTALGTKMAAGSDGSTGQIARPATGSVGGAYATAKPAPGTTQLTAGQLVRVSSDGTFSTTRRVDAERLLGWTEGRLYFDDAALREVALTLARRYGVRIEFADSAVAAMRLTAEFKQPSAREIVRLISLSAGLEYQVTDHGYLLFHSAPAGAQP